MTLALQPNQSGLSQMSALVPAGADVGAGLTKIVFDSGAKQIRLRLSSKLHQNKEELHDTLQSPEGGHFFYHSGDRKDLIGQEFLTGQLAAWKAPTTHLKLSDDPALKVEYGLHTILGALATLSYRAEWNLYFVLSTHNAKAFKQALTDKVSGTHFVSFHGKEKPQSKVNLTVSLVVPEGAGSYAYCAFHQLLWENYNQSIFVVEV